MTIEKAVAEPIEKYIVRRALELGFVNAGITGTDTPAHYEDYQAWLDRGDHGTMSYMADDFHKEARSDMRALLPSVKSVIVVALSYPKQDSALPDDDSALARGKIAQYALGDDYHYLIKEKLRELASDLETLLGHGVETRACVDSAPLLERELAQRSGLGFIGKNTMLITPGVGSYFVLGTLLTDLELIPTTKEDRLSCGECTLCLDVCPTQAFRAPYKLNASRCISYLTIESREAIPEDLRPAVGDHVFGCDECQSVCPYNGKAPDRQSIVPQMQARAPERSRPGLSMLADLGSNQRKRYVDRSPLRRNNREQLLRNVAVALQNAESLSDEDQSTLEKLKQDKSELVRNHANKA